jgi:hypothetical protein
MDEVATDTTKHRRKIIADKRDPFQRIFTITPEGDRMQGHITVCVTTRADGTCKICCMLLLYAIVVCYCCMLLLYAIAIVIVWLIVALVLLLTFICFTNLQESTKRVRWKLKAPALLL